MNLPLMLLCLDACMLEECNRDWAEMQPSLSESATVICVMDEWWKACETNSCATAQSADEKSCRCFIPLANELSK